MTKKHNNAFRTYSAQIKTRYREGDATEHTYRPALQAFIETFDSAIKATNEPGKKGRGTNTRNKPDFIIKKGAAPLGFIETKDLIVSIKDTEDTEQINRYCESYPNLIVTNYIHFRRYVRGELRAEVCIGKRSKSDLTIESDQGEELVKFFQDFLLEDTFSVSSAADLADRLATLTRQIRKLVKKELDIEKESAPLHKLMLAFKKVLLSQLDEDKFSDMFAQTLAYGFFAAKVHFDGKGEFSRRTASSILPKTNPFLRRLFREFADEKLPESLTSAVDDIVELLKKTDLQKILKEFGEQGKNDAVIHFYETFLGAYDPKMRKEMGVFYTPDPVVDYIVKSVDTLLTKEFGKKKGLADDEALILDPALGTGSFLHKITEKIHTKVQKGQWDSYVSESLLKRLFGFEILMAPYSVAHLNLGLQLQKMGYQFEKEQRLGVFLTNTLEETAKRSEVLFADWISEEADAAASIKRDSPIMVVVGNPPYAAESQNKGEWIHNLMRGYDSLGNSKCANYFECDGRPLGEKNPKALNDDYVKFIRFAHWRIEQTGGGVVAFITNHGYLENPTFRGMRESLVKDFDDLYLIDLHGSVKRKEQSPSGGKDENVFSIQTGVSICFLVKKPGHKAGSGHQARVFKADVWGERDEKFEWLQANNLETTKFKEIHPESPDYLFSRQDRRGKKEFETGFKITEIFPVNSGGIVTGRDSLAICDSSEQMWHQIKEFSGMSVSEARNHFELGSDSQEWKVELALKDVKNSGINRSLITPILYRPFDVKYTYYTGKSRGLMGRARSEVMDHMIGGDNIALITARSNKSNVPNHFFASRFPSEYKAGEATTGSMLFPLYVKQMGVLAPNLSPGILSYAAEMAKEEPELRFFEYMYGLLFSPSYREKYKDYLKLDFPRIQLTSDTTLFGKLSRLGRKLIDLHTLESNILDGGKTDFPIKGSNIVEMCRWNPKTKAVKINETQFFANISEKTWEFQVGGYQVLEKWLKDRKGMKLGHSEISTYEKIVESIERTLEIMKEIDTAIANAGGLPFNYDNKKSKKAA